VLHKKRQPTEVAAFINGSLVPSVGTNRSQQLMLVWIAEAAVSAFCPSRHARARLFLETNKENTMKMRIAILAACVGTFALVQVAQAGDVFGGAAVGIVIGTKSSAKAQPNNQKLKAVSGTTKSRNIADQAAGGNLSKSKR
jgi:hypothetical protein